MKNAHLNGKLTRYFEDGSFKTSILFSENGTIISAKTFQKKLPEKKIVTTGNNSDNPPNLKIQKQRGLNLMLLAITRFTMIMMKYGWMGFLKMGNFGMGKFIHMIEMVFYNEF